MAGFLCWAVPLQYEAEALVLVHPVKPSFFTENETPPADYDLLIKNQLALIRTPIVIENALENFGAADLPYPYRRVWLTKNIKVKRYNESSEILSVRFKLGDPETAIKIVNAVLDAYLLFVTSTEQDNCRDTLSDLQHEKNKYTGLLQQLYQNIRTKEKAATLLEEVALDISLEKDHLERIKKHLNRIEDRSLALLIEQGAPSQFRPLTRATLSPPLYWEKFMIVSISAVFAALVPPLLNFVFRRFRAHL